MKQSIKIKAKIDLVKLFTPQLNHCTLLHYLRMVLYVK